MERPLIIDGLTKSQADMLNKLWELNTTEAILAWFETLSEDEFAQAVALQDLLIQSMLEQPAEDDVSMARNMLADIGVRC